MSYQKQSFGMMDQGYFVPRGQILSWLNDLLKLNMTKIQQLGSGAVYCQVVDVIHPGKVAMAKLNWKARNDYEFINNLKILQNAFDKVGIKRHVQVQKLAKAKYQDNLQFIQWLKRYYDLNCGQRGNNYNAQERRGNVQVDLSFADKTVVPKTYNASGVVKTQTNVPQKNQKAQKVEKKKPQISTTNLAVKHQEGPARVKSPTQSKRIQVKHSQLNKKIQQKPKATKVQTKQIKKQAETQIQNQKNLQQHIDQKNHLLQQQLKKAFDELQQAKNASASYQQKLKQVEMKVQMIKQILSTQDDAAMKVSLIEEIFKQ